MRRTLEMLKGMMMSSTWMVENGEVRLSKRGTLKHEAKDLSIICSHISTRIPIAIPA